MKREKLFDKPKISIVPVDHDNYDVTVSNGFNSVTGSFTTCDLYALTIQIFGTLSKDINFVHSLLGTTVHACTDDPTDGVAWSCPYCGHSVCLDNICNSILFPRSDSETPLSVCPQCGRIVRLNVPARLWEGGQNA